MAKDFNKMAEDNPVMSILNAAKNEEEKNSQNSAKNANDILGVKEEPKATVAQESPVETTAPSPEPEKVAEVEVKKILMNISIRETTKKDWKMFFLEHDLSMTQGIETAVEYLKSEVQKGNIRLSKGGITK
ncbi:MAG: hypothetical protein KBT11_08295 [Treponema sp.]|nr:hypothetical protein [Candidatus Treponema equifaecale]